MEWTSYVSSFTLKVALYLYTYVKLNMHAVIAIVYGATILTTAFKSHPYYIEQ